MMNAKRTSSSQRGCRAGRPMGHGAMVLIALLVLLVFGGTAAMAFPFGRTSGVTELTPASLPGFVNSHKPVVVLFYAPWCGHCKQFHHEYERFADSVKGAIRVGAINADQHSEVGGQFGIRGFPTIKYWNMGSKSLSAPEEYQSHRTAQSLQRFMMENVRPTKVNTAVRSAEALKEAVVAAPQQKAAVLFSSKSKVPPIFSILALSPRLADLPFIFVEENEAVNKGMAASVGVKTVPAIGVVQVKAGTEGAAETLEMVPFSEGGISYEPLAKFFLAALSGELKVPAAAQHEAVHGNVAVEQLDKEDGVSVLEGQHRVREIRRALPVAPEPFDKDVTIPHYCAPSMRLQRLHGSVVWCVIVLGEGVDVDALHARYHNEPFLFFDASKTDLRDLESSLQEDLNGLNLGELGIDVKAAHGGDNALVLLRKTKKKRIRVKGFTGIDSTEKAVNALEKTAGGEIKVTQWKL